MSYAPVSRVVTPPSPGLSGTTLSVTKDTGDRFPALPFDALVWEGRAVPALGENAEEVRVTDIRSVDDLTVTRATDSTKRVEIKTDWEVAAVRTMTAYSLDQVVSLEHTFNAPNPPYHVHLRAPDGVPGSALATDAGAGRATYSFDPDKPGAWGYRFAGVSEEGPDSDFFVKFSPVL